MSPMYIYDNISLNSSKNEEYFGQNILCSTSPPPPPRKSCRLWDNAEKYCRVGQAIDDNMAHVHCMLDN
jgi:hypothetical protein